MQSIRKKTDFGGGRFVVVAAEGAEERMGFGQGRTTDGRPADGGGGRLAKEAAAAAPPTPLADSFLRTGVRSSLHRGRRVCMRGEGRESDARQWPHHVDREKTI